MTEAVWRADTQGRREAWIKLGSIPTPRKSCGSWPKNHMSPLNHVAGVASGLQSPEYSMFGISSAALLAGTAHCDVYKYI